MVGMRMERVAAAAGGADRGRGRARGEVERILQLAAHLAPADRALVEGVYRHGRSVAELAPTFDRAPRTLQQRLAALLKRMSSKEYQLVALHSELLPRPLQAVARRLILEGRPLGDVARRTGLTYHTVRHRRTQLLTLLRLMPLPR